MLDDIKVLLNINSDKEDVKLKLYIKIAVTLIKEYLNNDNFNDSYIEENFNMAIVIIVCNAYEFKKSGSSGNIKSMTQGGRSITYGNDKGFYITDEIKQMLPTPFVKSFY